MGHFAPDTTGGGNRWLNCELRAQSAGWKPVFEPPPALRDRPGFGGVCSALHTHRMTLRGVSSTYHKGERTLQPATTAGAIESKQSKMANKYPHPTKENHSASQNVREGGVLVGFTRERDTERERDSQESRFAKINERKGTIDQLATNRAPAPQHIQKKSRNASRTGPIQRISHQGKEAIHMFAD